MTQKDVSGAAPTMSEPGERFNAPVDLPPWFLCPSCSRALLSPGEPSIEQYFDGADGINCPECAKAIDLWQVMLHAVRDNFMLTNAFAVIGARTKLLTFKLAAGETKKLVFQELGIPEGARVLAVNYSPQGHGCFPVELHGNMPYRGLPRDAVRVYGRLHDPGVPETEIACAITWLLAPDEDDGWSHLLDAFTAYADGDWRGAIIPANIAAEAAISKAAYDAIAVVQVASKERLEEFLSRGATYSYQLNIVVPLIAKLQKIALLPDPIRGLLNRLRDFRNKVAHTGALPTPLKKEEVAELIVAATFGFHYGRFFRRKLSLTP